MLLEHIKGVSLVKSHQAARFEAAISVIGMRIAHLSCLHAKERGQAQPNLARIAELNAEINQQTDEQEGLQPGNTARIEQLLAGNE